MNHSIDTGGFRLGRILGVEIRVHGSWFLIFLLLLWTLGFGMFPSETPNLSSVAHAVMALTATLLFFASLVVHELAHAVVARSRDISVERITLFVFGGVAHTAREPERPGDELVIAAVGPLASLTLGGAFLAIGAVAHIAQWGPAFHEVVRYLGFVNVALATFNLLPGFPLDGGRVFRALAWRATGDAERATLWATRAGRALGWSLVALGGFVTLGGALVGGLWLLFIGLFLRGAAEASLTGRKVQHVLEEVPVSDAMSPHPEVVTGGMTLQELAQGPLIRSNEAIFPVEDGGTLVGLVSVTQLRSIPRERWSTVTVREAMDALDIDHVVRPDDKLESVVPRTGVHGARAFVVVDDDRVVGVVSRESVLERAERVLLVTDA